MKIPQTFIPNKDLEGKIELFLKEQARTEDSIDQEARYLFPNFIKRLKEEYNHLIIEKDEQKVRAWNVYLETEGFGQIKIAVIERYSIEPHQEADPCKGVYEVAEYGYKAEAMIRGQKARIEYRQGYRRRNTKKGIITWQEKELRKDTTGIPFP